MRDDQHSTISEIILDRILYDLFSYDVDVRYNFISKTKAESPTCRLIQDNEFPFIDQSSAKADQLLLPLAQIFSVRLDHHF